MRIFPCRGHSALIILTSIYSNCRCEGCRLKLFLLLTCPCILRWLVVVVGVCCNQLAGWNHRQVRWVCSSTQWQIELLTFPNEMKPAYCAYGDKVMTWVLHYMHSFSTTLFLTYLNFGHYYYYYYRHLFSYLVLYFLLCLSKCIYFIFPRLILPHVNSSFCLFVFVFFPVTVILNFFCELLLMSFLRWAVIVLFLLCWPQAR